MAAYVPFIAFRAIRMYSGTGSSANFGMIGGADGSFGKKTAGKQMHIEIHFNFDRTRTTRRESERRMRKLALSWKRICLHSPHKNPLTHIWKIACCAHY